MLEAMWGCVLGGNAEFPMTATRLRPGGEVPTNPDNEEAGHWESQQHPVTGQMIRVWVPHSDVPDDPDTPDVDEEDVAARFRLQATAVITGGLNTQGTAERQTSKGEFESNDFVRIKFPKNVVLTTRDRVTNVRDPEGKIVWVDEQFGFQEDGKYRPTVFNVLGVSPVLDPFGNHIENYALLNRASAAEREA